MSEDLVDLIQREIDRALASRPGIKAGTVSSYDSATHRMKVMMQPDQVETGWMPVQTVHAGSGIGIVAGPEVGDQVVIGHIGGDVESPVHIGRLHSDNERPPVAESGEVVIKTKNGTTIKIDKNGAVTLNTAGQALTIDASGSTITMKGDITHTGKFEVTGSSFKHNGHDVGSTHLHKDVTPGGGLTGVPQ